MRTGLVRETDFARDYIAQLGTALDMEAIRASGLRIGVDPLGGAAVHYWARIAEHYRLNLTVVNPRVDPAFAFMTGGAVALLVRAATAGMRLSAVGSICGGLIAALMAWILLFSEGYRLRGWDQG